MAKFYVIGKVSEDLMHRMQKEPAADRFESTKKVCDAIGAKLISYEWVRGRFDVICCVEADTETAIGMKVAFLNSGLMDQLMIHEVFDYNKAFSKAADAANSVVKPGK
tara:strand:- start:300 stop:623 length:324 start_codon:yes stop_codon:yes gene_type:complete